MASELVFEPQNRSESMKIRLFWSKITHISTKNAILETSDLEFDSRSESRFVSSVDLQSIPIEISHNSEFRLDSDARCVRADLNGISAVLVHFR